MACDLLEVFDVDTSSMSADFCVDISKTSQVSDADSSKPNSEVSGGAGNGRYYALTPVKGSREVFGGTKDGREDPDCDPW